MGRLIDADDCVLIVVDVQEGFLERVEPEAKAGLHRADRVPDAERTVLRHPSGRDHRVARGLGRPASRPGRRDG
jgi:hypothetical protein